VVLLIGNNISGAKEVGVEVFFPRGPAKLTP